MPRRSTVAPRSPHAIDLHVGQRVRLQRQKLGLSQSDLASQVGLTFQQVQKYEKGRNRISASRLADMARVLGVPVGWFFEGADIAPDSGFEDWTQYPKILELVQVLDVLSPNARDRVIEIVVSLVREMRTGYNDDAP